MTQAMGLSIDIERNNLKPSHLSSAIYSYFGCQKTTENTKAYIPPERKIPGVGGWPNDARFLRYPTQNIPTCWYILALPPTPIPDANPKICITPDANPDANQWNIGGVGLSGIGAGVGHVHFMLFMSISFALGTQRKLVFQWNMGLTMKKIK